VLIAGLIIIGLCFSLFALKRSASVTLTLIFSVLTTLVAAWGLWNPGTPGLTTSYLLMTPLRSWFLLILGIVSIASSWYRFGYRDHNESMTGIWLLPFLMSMIGVIAAGNVWVFMSAWELMSITSFFLVISNHHRKGVLASGYVYLVMSQLSAVAIVLGLLLIGASVHSMNFANWATSAPNLSAGTKNLVFALLGFGFAVKSGIIPFHIWLPRAHPVAPAPVSGLMSGVMIKLGIFGIIQFLMIDLGHTSVIWSIVLLVAGAVSSLLGILYALMESDLKSMLAYSSIENIGIIFLGLGVMALGIDINRPSLEALGMIAALFHTLNHAIFKSQLFLVAGAVEQHTGTLDTERMGGLIRTIPGIAVGFLAGAMAISGLPPFNGFASEWLVFRGLLAAMNNAVPWLAGFGLLIVIILAMTSALAGMAFVKAMGVIFLGEPRKELRNAPIGRSMSWPILALGVVNLTIGLFSTRILPVIAHLYQNGPDRNPVQLFPTHVVTVSLLFLLALIAVLLLARPWRVQTVPRWNCGRIPDASMQFTGTSFTKSIRTTLAAIYRPHRNLKRVGPYAQDFPETLIYEGGTTHVWERYLYHPGYLLAWWLSSHSTRLQAGPMRLYLTYLLGTVGILLLLLH
jgi:hydrogenase-4 component B